MVDSYAQTVRDAQIVVWGHLPLKPLAIGAPSRHKGPSRLIQLGHQLMNEANPGIAEKSERRQQTNSLSQKGHPECRFARPARQR